MRHLLPVATLLLLSAAGCTRAPAPAPEVVQAEPTRPESDALVAPEDAKVGDRTTCLVSGDIFLVEADTQRVEHEGRGFYVCCDGCVDDFRADPEKFLQRAP